MNKEVLKNSAEQALETLKDFQSKTVDNIYDNLYGDTNAKRHLVADEVGLGKTIVARGLIAKIVLERLHALSINNPIRIVYICSNQTIARQNLHKLNLLRNRTLDHKAMDRLIYLALKKEQDEAFQITALTPSTSFHVTRGTGVKRERKLMWTILTQYQVYTRNERSQGLKYLMLGSVEKVDRWLNEIEEFKRSNQDSLNDDVRKQFRKRIIHEKISLTGSLKIIADDLGYRSEAKTLQSILIDYAEILNHDNYDEYSDGCRRVIEIMRNILTDICTEILGADLFILDEFQRFKELIDQSKNGKGVSEATQIAQKVFSNSKAKVLMLSATPYKAYTTSIEHQNGESHFEEFKTVLKFLSEGVKGVNLEKIKEYNQKIREALRHPDTLVEGIPEEVRQSKQKLERIYRKLISRTERVLLSTDKNVLLEEKVNDKHFLTKDDIKHYQSVDSIQQHLEEFFPGRIGQIMNYIKSAPYMFSFMEDYQHNKKMLEWIRQNPTLANIVLRNESNSWIPLGEIDSYKLLPDKIPNLKMRGLMEEVLSEDLHKWLWLPPNMPYYSAEGAFKDASHPSKFLLFSKWRMVPRAVSALLSYDSERKVQQDLPRSSGNTSYFQKKRTSTQRSPTPILQLSLDGGVAATMRTFTLLYPSLTLCHLPWDVPDAKGLPFDKTELVRNLKNEISRLIDKADLNKYVTKSEDSQYDTNWYWVAPVLLDKYFHENTYDEWLAEGDISGVHDIYEKDSDKNIATSLKAHLDKLVEVYRHPESLDLGPMPPLDDLLEVLAMAALAAPANVAVRLQRIYDEQILKKTDSFSGLLNRALSIAFEFRTLFDKPESINIVRSYSSSGLSNESNISYYWYLVLQYCLDGNLQSVMDEYAHMLKGESDSLNHLCSRVQSTINIRTSMVTVNDAESILGGKSEKMRCHFAVPFGIQEMETESGQKRAVSVVENFNSPFRPFILASTSIGQEGLDLHFYCRKIVHWNLPYNPVDLEQREGRINRYKGLVIRQNIGIQFETLVNELPVDWSKDFWLEIFDAADATKDTSRSDLFPYWLVEPQENNESVHLERNVPLFPFSKDKAIYRDTISSLAFYRLTLGQPRQEELVQSLSQLSENENIKTEDIDKITNALVINLSPISYKD